MKKCVLWLLIFIVFSCGHVPPTHYYLLDISRPQASTAKKNAMLWIKEVSADAVHVQDRLIYRTSAFEIQYDPYRRWALTPTDMVKQEIMDYLRYTGLFSRISDRPSSLEQNFKSLSIRIREFEEYTSTAKRCGRVAFHVQIAEGVEDKLAWEGVLEAEADIKGSDAQAIVQAMSQAMEKTLQQLLEKLSASVF